MKNHLNLSTNSLACLLVVFGLSVSPSQAKVVKSSKNPVLLAQATGQPSKSMPVVDTAKTVPPLAQTTEQSSKLLQVIDISIPVYSQPNLKSNQLATVDRGTLVTLIATQGDWYQIELANDARDGQKTGWVLQNRSKEGAFALQELVGPGKAEVTNPLITAPSEAFSSLRGQSSLPRVTTLAPIDPAQTTLPAPNLPRESISIPDRWRLMQTLGFKFPLYDPYNQNVLKGDLPVFTNLAPDLFFNLGVISDNLLEFRTVPTPVSQTTSGSQNIFGNRSQQIQASTLILSLGLSKGNTTFRPPDFEFRFVPAIQFNHVNVGEAAALYVDPTYGTQRNHSFLGVQELFVDYHLRNVSPKFDFDSLRVGIQPFISDFRGFLFQDTAMGVRVFGNRDSNLYQYNLAAFQRIEKDTNSGLNNIGKPLRDDYVFAANLYRQDFPIVGFTSQVTAIHNLNRETTVHYDENGFLARPAFLGDVRPREYQVTYFGYSGDGHLGMLSDRYRLNLSTTSYAAVGKDNRSPLSQSAQDIQAYFHASELSRDFSWVRLRGSFLVASGDKDPYDNKATGFDAIFENPQFAGSDTSYFIRQSTPLIGGGGVGLSGRNGLLPSLRSSKEQGQSNFQNPGLRLYGIGADFDVLPQLRLFSNINKLYFMDTSSLSVLRNQYVSSADIGIDYSVGFHWRPYYNQNLLVNGSAAILQFGDGMKQLYGNTQSNLRSIILNAIFNF